MGNGYLWTKTIHIVLIASWFAGLFYLPRIYVNLAEEKNTEAYARLLGMAERLFRFMTILAIPALLCGLLLWLYFGIGFLYLKWILLSMVIGAEQVLSCLEIQL